MELVQVRELVVEESRFAGEDGLLVAQASIAAVEVQREEDASLIHIRADSADGKREEGSSSLAFCSPPSSSL